MTGIWFKLAVNLIRYQITLFRNADTGMISNTVRNE